MSKSSGMLRAVTIGVAVAVIIVSLLLPSITSVSAAPSRQTELTPVVLFPAFHFTKLLVTVRNQVVAPACPRSGTFEDWYANDHPSTTFSQVCRDKLLTLRYDPNPAKPMPLRFSNQRGVTVQIIDYGMTQSASFYETLYKTLEAAG
jgi:lecithin-cholesterol acyltransferase